MQHNIELINDNLFNNLKINLLNIIKSKFEEKYYEIFFENFKKNVLEYFNTNKLKINFFF
jgi:hypothetical protein